MVGLEHRNMETGAGFPARVAMGDGRVPQDLVVRASGGVPAILATTIMCAAALVAATSKADACSEARFDFSINKPMSVNADGSFENADTEPGRFGRDRLSGGKVYDRGNGRVTQRLTASSGPCGGQVEILVFTDCNSSESIELDGIFEPGAIQLEYFGSTSIKYIQPPYGPIVAGPKDTVASLAEQAQLASLDIRIKGTPDGLERGYWDNYRSKFGCKLFYPDSKGARS